MVNEKINESYTSLEEAIRKGESKEEILRLVGVNRLLVTTHNLDLEGLSMIDSLTKLKNRGGFYLSLEEQVSMTNRLNYNDSNKNNNLIIGEIDINDFKEINDNYGHVPVGDEVLRILAQIMKKKMTRKIDTIARVGGEEFYFILPLTPIQNAIKDIIMPMRNEFHDKVSLYLEKAPLLNKDTHKVHNIGLSIGILDYSCNKEEPEELVREVDEAMYQAKKHKYEINETGISSGHIFVYEHTV